MIDSGVQALILARLHHGEKPKAISDSMEGISYGQVLGLKRKLEAATTEEKQRELFNLPEAVVANLLEEVKNMQVPTALEGDLIDAVSDVADNIQAMQLLEKESADTATTLMRQIKRNALATQNSDTLLALSEAAAKIYTAYFAKSGVQIANFNNSEGDSFESMLKH